MNPEEIQASLNTMRDDVRAALEKFYGATHRALIGSFEAYVHQDGQVEYRVSADSQILFKSNDLIDTPRNRLLVIEALLACLARAHIASDSIPVLNGAFDEWRMRPTRFFFDAFAATARDFGIRISL